MGALTFTEVFGAGERLAENLATLYGEIIDCQGMRCWDGTIFSVTNLGELPSGEHLRASPISRHNLMLCPDGVWRCCACDFGGVFTCYEKLALFFQAMYRAHDDRYYPYGFCQFGDGTGLEWFTGNRKRTNRDQGHAHLDNNMASGTLRNVSSFVPSMTSRRPHGLRYFLATGQLDPAVGRGGVTSAPTDSIDTEAQLMAVQDDIVAAVNAHTDAMARANILSLVMPQLLKQGNRFFVISGDPTGGIWYDCGDGTRQWLSPATWADFGKPDPDLVSPGNPLAFLRPVGALPGSRYVRFPADTSTADGPLRVYQVTGVDPTGRKVGPGERYWISAAEFAELRNPTVALLPLSDPLATALTVNVEVAHS